MQTKTCRICKLDKPVSNFCVHRSHKDGLSSYCKTCNNNKMKLAYRSNPSIKNAQMERAKAKKELLQNIANQVKSKYGCCICPENNFVCLDFHHIDDNKENTISALTYKRNTSKLITEIKKCTILCANCHRKVHAGILAVVKTTVYDDNDFILKSI